MWLTQVLGCKECKVMDRHFGMRGTFALLLVLLAGTVALAQQARPMEGSIQPVSADEYFRVGTGGNQRFDTIVVSAAERDSLRGQYWIHRQKVELCDCDWSQVRSKTDIKVGRFMPSGTLAMRIVDSVDEFHFNGMVYTNIPAGGEYALSQEGLFASEVQKDGRTVLYVGLVDGFEWHKTVAIELDNTIAYADGLRWGEGGWLYFRGRDGYHKFHSDLQPRSNCRLEDMEISEAEYSAAKHCDVMFEQRQPTAADTAQLEWLAKDVRYGPLVWDDHEFLRAGKLDLLSFTMGDYYGISLLGDTTVMDFVYMLSYDSLFAGFSPEVATEIPMFVYMYRLLPDGHVSPAAVYQTTPAWVPLEGFWGDDGYLYVSGVEPYTLSSTYHKVRPPSDWPE